MESATTQMVMMTSVFVFVMFLIHQQTGHGHNYIAYVTLKGPVNAESGMVINLADVKKVLGQVEARFDHKHLDKVLHRK
jgi:6-pyruvoyl-tetrahydropterin synthase